MRVYVLGQLTVECHSGLLLERDLPGNQARIALAMLRGVAMRLVATDRLLTTKR